MTIGNFKKSKYSKRVQNYINNTLIRNKRKKDNNINIISGNNTNLIESSHIADALN